MTVKELIIKLLGCPLENNVLVFSELEEYLPVIEIVVGPQIGWMSYENLKENEIAIKSRK